MANQVAHKFVVESTIKAELKYGANKQRYQEPTKSPSLRDAWKAQCPPRGSIEAMSPAPPNTVEVFTRQNLFAKAVHAAFFGHHGLVISPDVIWITIMQGLANHVDQNAGVLREKFVRHQGKKSIEIRRPEFVKGSPENDWPGVFPEFAEKIKQHTVNDVAELSKCDFTTSGPVEQIVSQITLMDTVQHYFTYSMACGCGFPWIKLTGTPADWEKLRKKAAQLEKYGLKWWLVALLPALDEFVEAAKGKPNLDFWRSLCHIETGASFRRFEPITGWVQVFFPYLIQPGRARLGFEETKDDVAQKSLKMNTMLAEYVESMKTKVNVLNFNDTLKKGRFPSDPKGTKAGVELELFPPGLSSAPFTYKDEMTRKSHKMAFFGGVTCLVQHADGGLEPKFGWAVLDSGDLASGMLDTMLAAARVFSSRKAAPTTENESTILTIMEQPAPMNAMDKFDPLKNEEDEDRGCLRRFFSNTR